LFLYGFFYLYPVAEVVAKWKSVPGFLDSLFDLVLCPFCGVSVVRSALQILNGTVGDTRDISRASVFFGVLPTAAFVSFAFYGIFDFPVLLLGFPLIVAGILAELGRKGCPARREERNASGSAT
jgi:hypothetical protein